MGKNSDVASNNQDKKLEREEKKRLKFEAKEQRKFKHRVGDTCPLSHLKVAQIGKVISITNENRSLRRRLLDMGLTLGVTVEVKRISPMGDPIDVTVRGYDLCLRKADMDNITVEVIK